MRREPEAWERQFPRDAKEGRLLSLGTPQLGKLGWRVRGGRGWLGHIPAWW